MKETILAQQIAHEFVARFPMLAERFEPELFALAVLDFLRNGKDDDDRADAVRLSLAKGNRRSSIESIIDNAKEILDWPPKPKVVEPTPIPRPTVSKKLGRKRR